VELTAAVVVAEPAVDAAEEAEVEALLEVELHAARLKDNATAAEALSAVLKFFMIDLSPCPYWTFIVVSSVCIHVFISSSHVIISPLNKKAVSVKSRDDLSSRYHTGCRYDIGHSCR
jgi:hypothetical protein